jgi:hypothetical protein
MSRRVYLLGVGLALLAGAFLLTDALLWRPGVTEANVRRIRPGMTLAEVEALLGPFILDREDTPFHRAVREDALQVMCHGADSGVVHWYWHGEHGHAGVAFLGGRVLQALWIPDPPSGGGLLDRLHAWLGW